tara:strand:+ start:2140 stop:2274 length:135 start_codon:yes stop_codon:yes gene_type:complete
MSNRGERKKKKRTNSVNSRNRKRKKGNDWKQRLRRSASLRLKKS